MKKYPLQHLHNVKLIIYWREHSLINQERKEYPFCVKDKFQKYPFFPKILFFPNASRAFLWKKILSTHFFCHACVHCYMSGPPGGFELHHTLDTMLEKLNERCRFYINYSEKAGNKSHRPVLRRWDTEVVRGMDWYNEFMVVSVIPLHVNNENTNKKWGNRMLHSFIFTFLLSYFKQ